MTAAAELLLVVDGGGGTGAGLEDLSMGGGGWLRSGRLILLADAGVDVAVDGRLAAAPAALAFDGVTTLDSSHAAQLLRLVL